MVRGLIIAIIGLGIILMMYVVKDYHNQAKIMAQMTENNALKGNIAFMEKKIEKDYQTTLAISQRNQELEKEVARDKDFDWNADVSHSPVIKRLQAN